MFSYKDRTFCPYYEGCMDGDGCPRALTKDVSKGADRANMYISVFAQKPECFVQTDNGGCE